MTQYGFTVDTTAPDAHIDGTPVFGTSFSVRLSPGPHVTHVVSYTYAVNDGPSTTVKARADGTATIKVTFDRPGPNWVNVTSLSRNGWVSSLWQDYTYLETSPVVTSTTYPDGVAGGGVGVPGTFPFTARMPNITGFAYSIDWGAEQTVPASAGGTASITWTPDAPGGTS